MALKLSEDEIDDLIYFARAGEVADLTSTLDSLSARETVSPAEVLVAARDGGKSTCLHMATGNGNLEIVKLLVGYFSSRPTGERQAFLDTPNEFGNTGLHWAALGGHLGVVEFLVAEGASPALANDKNYIPLDLASFGEKTDVVDFFLGQMDKLESGNDGEGGLESAAAGIELDDGAEGAEDTEEAKKPSSSS